MKKPKEPRWSSKEPKYSKSKIAKALELRVQGVPLRVIERRTGLDYTYVCRLSKNVAMEQLPVPLQSERSRKAAIILLQREELDLTERLGKVKNALARFRAFDAPPPVVIPVSRDPARQGGPYNK